MANEILKDLLKNSGSKGEKIAGNIEEIVGKLNTAENMKAFRQANANPLAAQAAAGDVTAMTSVLKDLLGSAEGQKLVEQVKNITKE